jgi:hypothetical protein
MLQGRYGENIILLSNSSSRRKLEIGYTMPQVGVLVVS